MEKGYQQAQVFCINPLHPSSQLLQCSIATAGDHMLLQFHFPGAKLSHSDCTVRLLMAKVAQRTEE